jgi:hypothetical protein
MGDGNLVRSHSSNVTPSRPGNSTSSLGADDSPRPGPSPLLRSSSVKKIVVLLVVVGIAVLAAKKIRSAS